VAIAIAVAVAVAIVRGESQETQVKHQQHTLLVTAVLWDQNHRRLQVDVDEHTEVVGQNILKLGLCSRFEGLELVQCRDLQLVEQAQYFGRPEELCDRRPALCARAVDNLQGLHSQLQRSVPNRVGVCFELQVEQRRWGGYRVLHPIWSRGR
jgi:hypothetical protein